jgi:hypothetical protein
MTGGRLSNVPGITRHFRLLRCERLLAALGTGLRFVAMLL